MPSRRARAATLLAAVAAAAAAAGGILAARRRRGSTSIPQPAPVVPGPPSQAPVAEAVAQTWSCACGQEYRVQGDDRHRIYWLAGAAVSDPVLASQCPSCERPLPREHEPAAEAPRTQQ